MSAEHGTWYYQIEDPALPGGHFRHGGYRDWGGAEQAGAVVRELLDCAAVAADPVAARRAVSAAVHTALRDGRPMLDAGQTRDRLRRGLPLTSTLTVGAWWHV